MSSKDPHPFLGNPTKGHSADKKVWERPALRRLEAKQASAAVQPRVRLDGPPPNPGPANETS
jgi:hypothetical protein